MIDDCVETERMVNEIIKTLDFAYDWGSLTARDINIIQSQWGKIKDIASKNMDIKELGVE